MRKAIYISIICSMFLFTLSPVLATEVQMGHCGDGLCDNPPEMEPVTIDTGFTAQQGAGNAPVIKAKWEMLPREDWKDTCDDCDDVSGTAVKADESCYDGAQFWPTGEWGTYKTITVCAIATDADGVNDIQHVYADVFYPEDIALDNPEFDKRFPGFNRHQDIGCGEQHGYEMDLSQLEVMDGYELFCQAIRRNNYNLPTFNQGYDYDEICAPDGELKEGSARVYCAETKLKWEDPAGDYRVQIHAVDDWDVNSVPLDNYFRYKSLTAFETDFTSVDYGTVKIDVPKQVDGNLTWGDNIPSVRNVGNTRLRMGVFQDDMGLGKTTNGVTTYNVSWDARVGATAQTTEYDPFEHNVFLDYPLELSQMNKMDFSIHIKKIPYDWEEQSGTMVLFAKRVKFDRCDGVCDDGEY